MIAMDCAREETIARYRYLCRRGARKFLRSGLERCDLEQVAAIGLIKAYDRYDRSADTPFEAFAWLFVVGELMHYVRDHERLVRPPRIYKNLEKRWQRAYDELVGDLNREPTKVELACRMQIPVSLLDELRVYRERAVPEAIHLIQGQEPAFYRDAFDQRDERMAIEIALATLNPMERDIVEKMYDHGFSQVEIAKKLGYSQRHISRLHRSALQKMQRIWVQKSA